MSRPIFFFSCVWMLVSCQHNEIQNEPHEQIQLSLKTEYFDHYSDFQNNLERVEQIIIHDEEAAARLSQIDKIEIHSNLIYMMDEYIGKISVFDRQGNFVKNIGRRGNGPGEFASVSDFCFGSDCIYVFDGVARNVLTYDLEGKHMETQPVPFSGEIFMKLPHDEWLWGLAPYNEQKYKQQELIKINGQHDLLESYATYTIEDNNFVLPHVFTSGGKSIVYHRPIQSDLRVLTPEGEVSKRITLDFGPLSVKDEDKKDLAKFFKNSGGSSYAYIGMTPLVTEKYIMGMLSTHEGLVTFIIDRGNQNIYLNALKDYDPMSLNFPVALCGEQLVLSYMNADVYETYAESALSPDIKDHLGKGGTVLNLYHLK